MEKIVREMCCINKLLHAYNKIEQVTRNLSKQGGDPAEI